MIQRFRVHASENAYVRHGLYALEVIDAVTLERVSRGLKVVAQGLDAKPYVNGSGVFVWLGPNARTLERITIDPQTLPYHGAEIPGDQIAPRTITPVELTPRVGYPFTPGTTGLRGTLIASRTATTVEPVTDATVRLRWLDDDAATWRDATVRSRTDDAGDFAAILRLATGEVPALDAAGAITVRLHVERPDRTPRESVPFALAPRRLADPSTFTGDPPALKFAWDELQL